MQQSLFGRGVESAKMARDIHRLIKAHEGHARKEAQKALAARMGRMRGLPQKMGQAFSLKDEDLAADFSQLQDDGEPMPFEVVTQLLEHYWGKPHTEVLDALEPEGKAASLGQVHKGVLRDGRAVAIKVAYPGIREAVHNDLKMLGWLGKGAEKAFAGFEMGPYRDMLLADFEEELDYLREAALQEDYRGRVRTPELVVPRVVKELSLSNVLVTEWEGSKRLDAVKMWPKDARAALARTLVSNFIHMLFGEGWMHADPHPGNVGFRLDRGVPKVVLYDYGCVLRLDERQRLLMLRMLLQAQKQKGNPMEVLAALGFNMDLLDPIESKVPMICKLLLEPFLTQGVFDTTRWQLKQRLEGLLGEARWNFRFSGIPELMFIVRGFQGIVYYLKQLEVQVDWGRMLQPILFPQLADVVALSVPVRAGCDFQGLAKKLCLEVRRKGEKRVGLSFPAVAVERLEQLMGEDIRNKARQLGLDPQDAVTRARASGFAPCSLVELEDGDLGVHIWLE